MRPDAACALDTPPATPLATALHAIALLIEQRLILEVAHFADRVEVNVLPPLCPLAVASVDFGHAGELIDRARHYLAGADARTASVSPVFADLSALPPLLLLAGENEILLDDALRIGDAAAKAGTPARVLVGKGMQHDWPLTLPWLDESRSAWTEMQQFITKEVLQ